jgi:hypothetical protein
MGEPVMKSFMSAVVVYALLIAVTAFVYTRINLSTTDVYSTESARVDHAAPEDGRLGWQPPDS